MTTRPRLKLGRHLIPGMAAVALFVVMAAAFLSAEFPAPQGFGEGSITASIGYAMFDLEGPIPSENFLVTFEIIDVVLVAALAAAVMLARRESGKGPLSGSRSESESESESESGNDGLTDMDVRTDGGDGTDAHKEDDH